MEARQITEFPPTVSPVRLRGVVAAARCDLTLDPDDNDSLRIVIGGVTHTFVFKTAPGAQGADTQVTRGVSAAATRASLLNAINGVVDASVVPGSDPFPAVVADQPAVGFIRVKAADAQGGTPVTGPQVGALTLPVNVAANVGWLLTNFNESSGKLPASECSNFRLDVTAGMITATEAFIELPFAPTAFCVNVQQAAGASKFAVTDAFEIDGNAIRVTFALGVGDLAATDVVFVTAWA